MQIEWDGKTYDWDPDGDVGVGESMVIQKHTGYGHLSFTRGIDEGEPACLQAFMWAMKKANGERCSIAGLDFSVAAFYRAIQEGGQAERDRLVSAALAAAAADEAAGRKPNPSKPASKKTGKRTRTSAGGATPTSSASPTSAT